MKFHSRSLVEHDEVPRADQGRLEDLISQFTRGAAPASESDHGVGARANPCYVVSVHSSADGAARAQLEEITGLVRAQGDRVVGSASHRLIKPDPRTLIRAGVAERIGEQARACSATMLVVDAELSPSQTRNLEDATGLPVCDREAVILNVFLRHATTRQARMQVEIAHLQYLRPRIRGIGLDMDQQAGGIMGGKGSGETASELLARRIDGRIADLRRGLERLRRSNRTQRRARRGARRVALVGYTNAGKTSLMNALTSAGLSAADRPFETLDTTSRCLARHGGDVILSDTVGFIRRLPERLFASFESTLAEVAESDLLLVVVDASDAERSRHLEITKAVLDKLDAGAVPRLLVLNKIDRLPERLGESSLAEMADGDPCIAVSSYEPEDVEQLRERILRVVRSGQSRRQVFVPYDLAEVTGAIYASCRVLESHASARGTQFLIEGEAHVVEQIARSTRRRQR